MVGSAGHLLCSRRTQSAESALQPSAHCPCPPANATWNGLALSNDALLHDALSLLQVARRAARGAALDDRPHYRGGRAGQEGAGGEGVLLDSPCLLSYCSLGGGQQPPAKKLQVGGAAARFFIPTCWAAKYHVYHFLPLCSELVCHASIPPKLSRIHPHPNAAVLCGARHACSGALAGGASRSSGRRRRGGAGQLARRGGRYRGLACIPHAGRAGLSSQTCSVAAAVSSRSCAPGSNSSKAPFTSSPVSLPDVSPYSGQRALWCSESSKQKYLQVWVVHGGMKWRYASAGRACSRSVLSGCLAGRQAHVENTDISINWCSCADQSPLQPAFRPAGTHCCRHRCCCACDRRSAGLQSRSCTVSAAAHWPAAGCACACRSASSRMTDS